MRNPFSILWRRLKRIVVSITVLWFVAVIAFSFLPVPFSMMMIERQVSALMSINLSYVSRSSWMDQNHISPYIALAVIAAEDQKFPKHWGFDFEAIETAMAYNKKYEKRIRGASTISQQTTKNLFLWEGRSWIRKGLETGMTAVLELLWSKKRILTVYLNIAEFGNGIFGVEEAAQHYFGKPAYRLTATESALLAAVLPNPHRYKVNAPSRYVLQRQQWILRQMQLMGGVNYLKQNKLGWTLNTGCEAGRH
ncbi:MULTISPECIES: monofunctional biosynthetic peptidoglycan transglycosylase [Xenorhabdus]|uniref:Biosynthetic peptidoglycan transglycosylase n=1 Tax=Xenorhabdus ehlersii TaxID=290111 RepID=A0A2D0IYT4_9GAMM|nr:MULTISPECIES: monofunctional biosynthetic peptidoglycan transglycosylase [Xenorhabdus]MBC8948574.1 bifunctional penicillin-insensitive transglycosylase/penicillin-sensitive transpeptidase [Xenorhabdus sp. TS4]PHM27117.1 bifunctional penicillin-insensitive transglycosylase/penicillin-sensitive transpeptidase [Xenorhabdus ehlersii]RKE92469.1 monofunctional biosynthetic peptidoglycan transglycosylase [Xenorhabdus ehlersii]